jgi:protocatechuate 3,4-dioxygenase beta subunit
MLLDPAFVEDHCFRLGKDSDDRRIVLEFEPTRDRRRVAEIAGALTVDRRTAELRDLEFRYVNVSSDFAEYARGRIDYARLKNGGWVISRWTIQMPVTERSAPGGGSFLGQRVTQADTRVGELQVTGGVVTAVVANRDTLWLRQPTMVTGRVTDSTSGSPIAGATVALSGTSAIATTDERGRFTVEALVPGSYTAEIHTPALDSVGAVHTTPVVVTDSATALELRTPTLADLRVKMCGAGRLDEPGVVVGHVTPPAPGGARIVRVTAVWQALSLEEPAPGRVSLAQGRRSVEARAGVDGTFRLCGVPLGTDLRIYATGEGVETPSPTTLRIKAPGRFASVDLRLEPIGRGNAAYFGVVLVDSTERPVAGADVALSDLARVTTTDALGNFHLDSIPPGEHRVVIRRLGFAPITTTLVLRPGERRKQTILLARAVTLDSVRVVATELDRAMASFEEHRRVGLGSFLSRSDLAKQETLTAAAALQTLRGLRMIHGRNGYAWVVGGRGAQSLGATSLRQGDRTDRTAGATPACYALVFLDGRVAYAGRENEPLFNVNSVRPSDLEAAEFYAGPGEAPGEYANLNSTCGILVLWSRR